MSVAGNHSQICRIGQSQGDQCHSYTSDNDGWGDDNGGGTSIITKYHIQFHTTQNTKRMKSYTYIFTKVTCVYKKLIIFFSFSFKLKTTKFKRIMYEKLIKLYYNIFPPTRLLQVTLLWRSLDGHNVVHPCFCIMAIHSLRIDNFWRPSIGDVPYSRN